MSKNIIKFMLNTEQVSLENVDPNLTVLQYLRDNQNKSGTKEGCASGDCGACTVVLAELSNDEDLTKKLSYKAINACITFVGTLHGKQLITVEDLKAGANLHHVQQSMVDSHGSQCGFCTPGFIMSSFALHKKHQTPNKQQVLEALAGNLCRCTGYRSIIEAATVSSEDAMADSFTQFYQETLDTLLAINQATEAGLIHGNKSYYAPKTVEQLADRLLTKPTSKLLAGGTDLALSVTQQLASIEQLVYLGDIAELTGFSETQDNIIIGAAAPYSKIGGILSHYYHELGEMIERIGSLQVRNNGTLGGNIGNASPIGDMPPALIALNAKLILQKGHVQREIPLEAYFVDYKKTVLASSEFIRQIIIPKPATSAAKEQLFKVYKISKRLDDDISAVLASISIELTDNIVTQVRIAFGGMAAIPARAKHCEAVFIGNALTEDLIQQAQVALLKDFSPMTDVRATREYRMKVAQNLLMKCYLELQQRSLVVNNILHGDSTSDSSPLNTSSNIEQLPSTRVTHYA